MEVKILLIVQYCKGLILEGLYWVDPMPTPTPKIFLNSFNDDFVRTHKYVMSTTFDADSDFKSS